MAVVWVYHRSRWCLRVPGARDRVQHSGRGRLLRRDGRAAAVAVDAAEQGVMVTESDCTNTSVGLSGFPDRDGHVTLDACIMDEEGKDTGLFKLKTE